MIKTYIIKIIFESFNKFIFQETRIEYRKILVCILTHLTSCLHQYSSCRIQLRVFWTESTWKSSFHNSIIDANLHERDPYLEWNRYVNWCSSSLRLNAISLITHSGTVIECLQYFTYELEKWRVVKIEKWILQVLIINTLRIADL